MLNIQFICLENYLVFWNYAYPVITGGDFDVHVNDPTDMNALRLLELLSSVDTRQHVTTWTHVAGHTLDQVITFNDFSVDELTVDVPGAVSNHSLVTCSLKPPTLVRQVWSWNKVDRLTLRQMTVDSPISCAPSSTSTIDKLFQMYDSTLHR